MQPRDPLSGVPATSSEHVRASDRHPSAARTAAMILAAQPFVVFLAVLVTALTACIALLMLDVRQGMTNTLNRMIDATKVLVFLDPEISRRDAEDLGGQFTAIPGVRDAQFRPKEEAISKFEAAQGKDGSSFTEMPAPDVWVLSVRAAGDSQEPTFPSPSLISAAERLQSAAENLHGVQFVRFDRPWIAQLDRWTILLREASAAVTLGVVSVLLIILFGFYFLSDRVLLGSLDLAPARFLGRRVGVSACIGFLFASLSGIFAFVFHGLAVHILSQFAPLTSPLMQPWLTAFGHSMTQDTLTVAAAIFLTALMAALLASRGRSTRSSR